MTETMTIMIASSSTGVNFKPKRGILKNTEVKGSVAVATETTSGEMSWNALKRSKKANAVPTMAIVKT